MKNLAFNLAGAKKIASDKKSSTFKLKSGHQLKVAHAALSPERRQMIEEMPLHAEAGADVQTSLPPSDSDAAPPDDSNQNPLLKDDPASLNPPTSSGPGVDVGAPADQQPAPSDSTESSDANRSPATATEDDGSSTTSSTPGQNVLPDLSPGNIYQTGMQGIQAEQKATEQTANQQLQANKDYEAQLAQRQQAFDQGLQDKNKEVDSVISDMKAGHINPNAYLENMSTGQKIGTAIGLFLGGWSSAYTGQGNPAMQFLQNQINRDVEAQKANLDNKKTVLGAYYDQTHNLMAAESMARATQNAIYASKFQDAALSAATPQAKAKALQAAAALQSQIYPFVRSAQWTQTQEKLQADNGGNNIDSQVQSAMMQARLNGDQEGYKDLQSRYMPGVGLAKIPVTPDDKKQMVNLENLDQNISHAIALQKQVGDTGAWSVNNRAGADNIKQELLVSLNELYNAGRLNEHVYNNYQKQIGNIGGVNIGGTLQGLKNMQSELQTRKQAIYGSVGLRAPMAPQSLTENEKAVAWARDPRNLNDPRAAAIKKQLGVQ